MNLRRNSDMNCIYFLPSPFVLFSRALLLRNNLGKCYNPFAILRQLRTFVKCTAWFWLLCRTLHNNQIFKLSSSMGISARFALGKLLSAERLSCFGILYSRSIIFFESSKHYIPSHSAYQPLRKKNHLYCGWLCKTPVKFLSFPLHKFSE